MMKDRVILHIDMDAFFASVEESARPQLKGKPVIVGGPKRRGVVSAASYEARKYGIKAGMPLSKAKKLCPQAIFLEVDGEKYLSVSRKLLQIFLGITPLVEPFSIDEAFLDVTGSTKLFGSPLQISQKIKQMIKEKLRITCSIGIAPNKLLAKLASDMNKPDGLTIIEKEKTKEIIFPLPVEKLWGVGAKTKKTLDKLGITTIGELAQYPVEILEKEFGKKYGEGLHRIANGMDDSPVIPYDQFPQEKSMGHEHTLSEDTNDPQLISFTLLSLSTRVARRLREAQLMGRTITLKLRYSDFFTLSKMQSISEYTNSEKIIYKVAKDLLDKVYVGLRKVRLLGVTVSNLVSQDFPYQLSLFDSQASTDKQRKQMLFKVMDKIRDKYGEGAIEWAGSIVLKQIRLKPQKKSEYDLIKDRSFSRPHGKQKGK